MPFENEYVSAEDIEKYKLDDLWKRTHLGQAKLAGRHSWTIDKEKSVFLMFIRSGHEIDTANIFTALLWWNGQEIYLELERVGNANIKQQEGHGTWHLRSIEIPSNFKAATIEEIKEVVKEALTKYGLMGVYLSVQKYFVNFSF